MKMNRKKKLIYGFVAFLLLMLCFYMIARGIYADNLAQVDVASPEAMPLNHAVNVVGNVNCGSEEAVFVPENLPVSRVQVRQGDQVKVGDVLFACDMDGLWSRVKEQELEISKLTLQLQAISKNTQLSKNENAKQQSRAEEDYQNVLKTAQTDVERAQIDVNRAENRVKECENEIAFLKQQMQNRNGGQVSGGDAMNTTTDAALNSAMEEAKTKLCGAQTNLETAGRTLTDVIAANDKALKNVSRQIEDAKAEMPADATYATLSLELEARKEQMEEYSSILENDGQVLAKREGLVTGVNIEVGGWTSSQAAFLFADTESPYVFETHLSKEQKQYVSQGMPATISLEGNRKCKGKVDYLTESRLGDGSFDVTVYLEDSMGSPGESGILRTSLQTEIYGCCIPLEALHQDSNLRNYVYVLVETEGILGTELSVRKQFVEILDQNDSYAAIRPGAFGEDVKVITYATKEITEGSIVRMRN